MPRKGAFISPLAILCLAAGCVLCQENNITAPVITTSDETNAPKEPVKPVDSSTVDPERSFYDSLKENVNRKTPVDRLDEMSKDVLKEMRSNPYFQIPKLDRRLREIAILHPDVMESLGVYVIPVKTNSSQENDTIANDLGPLPDLKDDKDSRAENPMQSNLSHIIKQSEMIKAMTPEEKLHFIPKLKETIVYEILKNSQTIDQLTAQLEERRAHDSL